MGELEQASQVLVIGSGPGGYAAAFRAADLGLEVMMVDPSLSPGGRCLYDGCIPAKSLLFMAQVIRDAERLGDMGVAFDRPRIDLDAVRRRQAGVISALAENLTRLSRRRDIQLVRARAEFEDSHTVRLHDAEIRRIRFEHAIVAVGAQPTPFPEVPFVPGGRIMNAADALKLPGIPADLLVIGGGYIGLELGTIYAALGSRVHLVQMSDRLLPGLDADLVAPLQQRLESYFESMHLQTRVTGLQTSAQGGGKAVIEGSGTRELRCDRAVVAIGNRPSTQGLGLEHTRVDIDPKGFIKVDRQQCTTDDAILAVGDVTGGVMLAHKAAREGKVAAETLAGRPSAFDVQAIPAVVYTDPQIASCGMSEEAARRANREVRVLRFPWRYSDRAATVGGSDGLTKIIVEPQSGRIIGAGIVGRQAEALIAEAVLAIEMGALAEDMALSLHPHPTLSETQEEAAELFLGNATRRVLRGESQPGASKKKG
ncbi:MAG: dihydrolipoamide dehydrogenase [Desulfatitalea sp. BRH_c12]|nr:MAG: dihydrolipoamide dehydrogenase [Desulfatitalea sp. BRH_c12]